MKFTLCSPFSPFILLYYVLHSLHTRSPPLMSFTPSTTCTYILCTCYVHTVLIYSLPRSPCSLVSCINDTRVLAHADREEGKGKDTERTKGDDDNGDDDGDGGEREKERTVSQSCSVHYVFIQDKQRTTGIMSHDHAAASHACKWMTLPAAGCPSALPRPLIGVDA